MSRMKEVKHETGLSYAAQCRMTKLPYASFMRWKSRIDRGLEPAMAPGPRKVEPFARLRIREQVQSLHHCRHRTKGTGAVYEQWRECISRRSLAGLIEDERREVNRQREASYERLIWHVPRLVWGMDDSQYRSGLTGTLMHLHSVQDLASRYKFVPVVGERLCNGEQVAENLCELIDEHGAPLFLKRDNGSNLNHGAVDDVLAHELIIPLNSPPYYPQYNGGIERAQREMKTWIGEHEPATVREAQLLAVPAVHDLNHKNRPCLQGKTACEVHGDASHGRRYTRRQRRDIYDWITEMSMRIIDDGGQQVSEQNAWRLAAEIWLRENRFVTRSTNSKCYPVRPREWLIN